MSDVMMFCPWCFNCVELTAVSHTPGKHLICIDTRCIGCKTTVKFRHRYADSNESPLVQAIDAFNKATGTATPKGEDDGE